MKKKLNSTTSVSDVTHARIQETYSRAFKYHLGINVKKNWVLAAQLYDKCIAWGVPEAMYERAMMLIDGNPTPDEVARAIKLFNRASELGLAKALTGLGLIHVIERYGVMDTSMARAYFLKAAEAGEYPAVSNLAQCHREGVGGPVNELEADALLLCATVGGYFPAVAEMRFRLSNLTPEQFVAIKLRAESLLNGTLNKLPKTYDNSNCHPDYIKD